MVKEHYQNRIKQAGLPKIFDIYKNILPIRYSFCEKNEDTFTHAHFNLILIFFYQWLDFMIFFLKFFNTLFQSANKKMSRYPHDAKVYVGDLGSNASKQEIEDAFGYYGTLRSVWVARNPPGFAFVEFESARDAEDSVRGLDGRTVCGRRARVELSTGKSARFKQASRSSR